jgi:endonuclease III
MHEYKRLNFKNHISIKTEVVKFLTINTIFKAIEELMAQVAMLEGEANKAKKKLNAVEKASNLAGNKADNAKRLSEQLTKQVAKQVAKLK